MFSADGRRLAFVASDRSASVWEVPPLSTDGHVSAARPILGNTVTETSGGTFKDRGFDAGGWLCVMWGTPTAWTNDPDHEFLVAANAEGGIVVWDQQSHERVASFALDGRVDLIVLGRDRMVVLQGQPGQRRRVRVYSAPTKKQPTPAELAGFEVFVGSIADVALTADEQSVSLTESDGYKSVEPIKPDVPAAAQEAIGLARERGGYADTPTSAS